MSISHTNQLNKIKAFILFGIIFYTVFGYVDQQVKLKKLQKLRITLKLTFIIFTYNVHRVEAKQFFPTVKAFNPKASPIVKKNPHNSFNIKNYWLPKSHLQKPTQNFICRPPTSLNRGKCTQFSPYNYCRKPLTSLNRPQELPFNRAFPNQAVNARKSLLRNSNFKSNSNPDNGNNGNDNGGSGSAKNNSINTNTTSNQPNLFTKRRSKKKTQLSQAQVLLAYQRFLSTAEEKGYEKIFNQYEFMYK